jgi:hypothetical protein
MYRGTSKRTPPGPYREPMPMVLGGSPGGWAFSYERGTPVVVVRGFVLPVVPEDGGLPRRAYTRLGGYLAHTKALPHPLGPAHGPRQRPTVG